jgi:hypothetical protein
MGFQIMCPTCARVCTLPHPPLRTHAQPEPECQRRPQAQGPGAQEPRDNVKGHPAGVMLQVGPAASSVPALAAYARAAAGRRGNERPSAQWAPAPLVFSEPAELDAASGCADRGPGPRSPSPRRGQAGPAGALCTARRKVAFTPGGLGGLSGPGVLQRGGRGASCHTPGPTGPGG